MLRIASWLFIGLFAAALHGADKVGNVVALDGGMKAVAKDRVERSLAVDSDIFLGDTLITEADARGQLQFTDGTLLLLIPGTEFLIEDYASGYMGKNRFASKLKEGGVRVSTGMIAKKKPENFEVETPNATIGVRGTLFEARMYQRKLFAGASSGNLSLKNRGGYLAIGDEQKSQFAEVPSQGKTPAALGARPSELALSEFELPAGGIPFGNGMPTGNGAMAGRTAGGGNGFAWAPAVGSIAVIGTIVGVVASAASQTPSTFSHSSSGGGVVPPQT